MKENKNNWKNIVLSEKSSIGDAVKNLEDTQARIVAVEGKSKKFMGIVCDGDIRRGLLKGIDLNSSIMKVIQKKPLVVPPEMSATMVKDMMAINNIHQIPVINKNEKLVGLHLWDDLFVSQSRDNIMIIMAGGRGTRMESKTDECPKPMLRVSGKPMLEHIIESAKKDGFINFIISINYLGSVIKNYFKDGKQLGVNIKYISEDSPLGTAGALSLIKNIPKKPFIVTNGDVITEVRYGEMLEYHIKKNAEATMAVRPYEWQNPFGVIELNGNKILSCNEKPIVKSNINAGVYVLNPSVLKILRKNIYCDMPSLFIKLKEKGKDIIAYPIHEPWLDVGKPDDLMTANKIK